MFREGDVEKVLSRLGIEHSERGRELMGRCPGHVKATGREDRNPSWSINAETGAHHCFSCGYKGSIVTLIADLLDVKDLEDARRWLEANVEVDLEQIRKETEALRDRYIAIRKPIPMSEARLAVFSEPPQWALDARRLTADACRTHSVKWMEALDYWVLPIREPENGKLMGWQEKGQGHRHFKNRPAGLKKAETLFGIEQFVDLSINQMIIVESPLDAVRLTSLGVRGGVAAMGASVSVEQVKLMRRADVVTIAMDNDTAGQKALTQISDLCRRYGIEYKTFNYGDSDAKDIGDMDSSAILEGLRTAKHMAFGNLILGGSHA